MTPEAVSPQHYRFGDVQLISVTRELSSNGGQAVQYIARATRTDGQNKSSDAAGQLEDLLKAQVFLTDEIARLRGSQPDLDDRVRRPRVWGDCEDIPAGVKVRDRDGDEAVIVEQGFSYYWTTDSPEDTVGINSGALREYAPYTEVLS